MRGFDSEPETALPTETINILSSHGLLQNTKQQYDSTQPIKQNDDESILPPEKSEQAMVSLSGLEIAAILSMAFSYGCIMTTLFLITLPVECERIEQQHPSIPKSVALGIFVAISGITNLISPLVGMLSDTYRPPRYFELGQRMPYFVFGGMCSTVGLLGQYVDSYENLWLRYGTFYFFTMIGLNICYTMMIALIPDQVPKHQIGIANGILAFLIVTGSLFGFGLFHLFFERNIQDMYGLYVCMVTSTTILTSVYAHDRDATLNARRGVIVAKTTDDRRSKRRIILGPFFLLKTMVYDPMRNLDRASLTATYSIDTKLHHDFFVVTISRLFYYCGVSIQTVHDNPESAVAYLAVLGQISGAIICYPVGFASDQLCQGRRIPFVFIACSILGVAVTLMIFAKSMDDMTILCIAFGAGNGMYLTMETSLAVDTLPEGYHDGPSGGNAQLLGIWGVAAFLGSALGPMIGGPLLYIFGKGREETYDLRGYAVIMGLSTFYFLLSALSLRWVKKPSV